ncbi:MAG: hypothetical protein AAFN94_04010 [Pseudomonadota bacterium]
MRDGIAPHRHLPEVAELIFDRFEQMEFAFAEAQEATREATRALEAAVTAMHAAPAPTSGIEAALARIEEKVDRLSEGVNAQAVQRLEYVAQLRDAADEPAQNTRYSGSGAAERVLDNGNQQPLIDADVRQMHEAFLNDLRLAVAECLAQVLKSRPDEVQRLDAP